MEKVDTGDFLSSSNTGDFLVGDDGLAISVSVAFHKFLAMVGFWWSVSDHVEWIFFFLRMSQV